MMNDCEREKTFEIECGSNTATLYQSKLKSGSSGPSVLFEGKWLTLRELMRERILVAGELEAETHEGGESSERERKQMVLGDEQEGGRYLGLQTSSVVNSKIMVRNLALKEKQGDASDLDKLAEVAKGQGQGKVL